MIRPSLVLAGVVVLGATLGCQPKPTPDEPTVLDGMTHPCDLVPLEEIAALLERNDLLQFTVTVPADTAIGALPASGLEPPFAPRELAAKCDYQPPGGDPILEVTSTRFYRSLDAAIVAVTGESSTGDSEAVPLGLDGAEESVVLENPLGQPVVLAVREGTVYAVRGIADVDADTTQGALALLLASVE